MAGHRAQEFSVSVVTWGELAAGFEKIGDVEHILRRIKIHYLPLHVAWQASRIERQLGQSGQRLGENDNWIAATALAFGLRLVTNDEDFRRVSGLRRIGYVE
jgi:predicted nucleic acid-binding protein